MKMLGASLEHVQSGRVHISVPFSPDLTQQHGYAHAGVIASIADSACGYAAMTLAPDGAEVLTIEFKISLIAPARGTFHRSRSRYSSRQTALVLQRQGPRRHKSA
jgi:uncharacterized protein (TIGR00369 family)